MRARVRPLVLLSALVAGAGARPARAQEAAPALDKATVERAKQFFEAGKQAYEAGKYETAITAFENAYALSPRAAIVFSMAQAYRRQYFNDTDPRKLKRAVELYDQYVREVDQGGRREDAVQLVGDLKPLLARIEEEQRKAGKGPVTAATMDRSQRTQLLITSPVKGAKASIDGSPPGEVPVVREVTPGPHKIRGEADGYFPDEQEATAVEGGVIPVPLALREKPARVSLRARGGADIAVDGRPVGVTPLARPLEVPAGRRFLSVSARGHHPFTRELVLKRGEEVAVTARLETTTQRKVAWYFFGGAGLVLLAGGGATVGAFLAEGKAQDILDRQQVENLGPEDLAAYERQRDRRDNLRTAAYLLYGGAVTLGVTGLLLYIVDHPRVEAPGTGLAPVLGGDGAGISWTERF